MAIRPNLRFGKNPAPTGAAFALVRKLLQERPMHFQELLHDGIKALGGQTTKTSTDIPSEEELTAKNMKKRGKSKVVEVEALNPVPEGHPFISGHFLKSQIIPILRSQQLITRKWTTPTEGTRLAVERPGVQTVMWELNTKDWRGKMWKNLTRPDLKEGHIAQQSWEVKQCLAKEALAAREAEFDSGAAERTDRQAMVWKGRPKGISYPLERLHLSTRRARNRPAKEQRRAEEAALRREAEQAAKQVVAGEK